jgi:hypothetical protein
MVDRALLAAAELGEAAYLFSMQTHANEAARSGLGLAAARIGGGIVSVVADDPTGGFWNRAIGLGVTEPMTEPVLDDVIGFATASRAPLMCVQVAPEADPPTWPDLFRSRGLTPSASWVKFAGRPVTSYDARTDLRVAELDQSHGPGFADVMCRGFGMPTTNGLPDWFATLPGADGWTTYGAFDDEQLVAVAALYCADGAGTLCGAATLVSHRGRGAQGVLMKRRIEEAARQGCTWVTSETGAETPDSPNPSLHNMRRIGLTELYERQNWIWRP